MSGGQKFEYLWADGVKYKKATPLPAPQYISLLMDWVETQINDEHVFPVTVGMYMLYL
ncbi:MOB kinase activator 3B [Portunus trituberculatus]|uniref:MOB kinase activator 3B n=1 Tax=Portunus trituberculatus TaxID=210409 RepID=A0A5B7KA32_PORTR|nr:MOB kinase activator 3B [Portunus trituberculatus]